MTKKLYHCNECSAVFDNSPEFKVHFKKRHGEDVVTIGQFWRDL